MSKPLKIALATFVKTPGHSPIKTRLAKDIGVTRSLEFYVTSLNSTFETIEQLKNKLNSTQVTLEPFWAVAENAALESPFWKKWQKIAQGDGDLGHRLAHVYKKLKNDFDIVAFFGADSPHVSSDRLLQGIQSVLSDKTSTVVGPTEDGGFYFLASHLSVSEKVWTSVQYSSDQTLAQLKKAWPEKMVDLETDYDIDTVEDLTRLALEDAVFGRFQK